MTLPRAILILAAVMFTLAAEMPRTFILVRHAERAGQDSDSELSEAGHKRASLLAEVLRDINPGFIFTSEFRRTKQTAAPLAKTKGLVPVAVATTPALIGRLKALAPGSVAIVINHSNTVPEIAAALGASTPPIEDSEFDRMLLIRWSPPSPAEILTLRYGPK